MDFKTNHAVYGFTMGSDRFPTLPNEGGLDTARFEDLDQDIYVDLSPPKLGVGGDGSQQPSPHPELEQVAGLSLGSP